MNQAGGVVRLCVGGAIAAACGVLAGSALSVSGIWLAPMTAIAMLLAYLGYRRRVEEERRHAHETSELHLATIEALALAIDAKDQTTPNHVRRVQTLAVGLARALGMSDTEIQGIKTAALLHDIGKLAVPEHILAKPGALTPEEFQKVRVHPQVGADIVATIPFPYPVTSLILSHHERWDGGGYPSGLKEDEIPLGARVLAVADYFDALTSDRPYHKAITLDAAIGLLKQESGKALDPRIVDAFVTALPELLAAETPDPDLAVPTSPDAGEPGLTSLDRTAAQPQPSVFADIAVARREIYGLYQIAQSMGTSLGVAETMALISSKLSDLVPFSACGLFLYSKPDERLQCRFATGTDSELIQQLTLRTGQGLTGWVARNQRPLVNARPSADLEAMGSKAPTILQSALVCPLIFEKRLIGTLAVYHTDVSFYGEDHRRLLDRICEQAAAVINNAVIFEQTQEASLTDPLTGLPNTRSMFQHLTRELARAERLSSEVALLVMDLDRFKEINDSFGHQAGDQALRDVAAVLRGAIRPYDMCVRYAGDEFIVVLGGCGREEAESKRLELKNTVERIVFEPRPGERFPLAISAGAAIFPQDGDTYEALLAKADGRMYQDKNAQKNTPARRVATPAARGGVRVAAAR